jgi:hypothetical protein
MSEFPKDHGSVAVNHSERDAQKELMMMLDNVVLVLVLAQDGSLEGVATGIRTIRSLVLAMRVTLAEIAPTVHLTTLQIPIILTTVVRKE